MAILTDDCDLSDVYLRTIVGGNGDYYIQLFEYEGKNCKEFHTINYRMAMSGGFTRKYPEVQKAVVELFRAMENAGLNDHPKEKKS